MTAVEVLIDMKLDVVDCDIFVNRLLLFVLVLSHFFFQLIAASKSGFDQHVNKEKNKSERREPKYVRLFKLYNVCSKEHVQILGTKRINALASQNNKHALLRVESQTFGSRVRIQSAVSLNYLCFNKRGRLIARYNGKSKRCAFIEKYTEGDLTEFQSHYNANWYLGFRANGRPLKGNSTRRRGKGKSARRIRRMRRKRKRARKDCFLFMKRGASYVHTRENERDTYGPIADFSNVFDHKPAVVSSSHVVSRTRQHRTRHGGRPPWIT